MGYLTADDKTERVIAVGFEGGETSANFDGVSLPANLFVTEVFVKTDEIAVTAGTVNVTLGGTAIAITGIVTAVPQRVVYTESFSTEAFPILVTATSLTEPWSLHLKVIEFNRRDDEIKPLAVTHL